MASGLGSDLDLVQALGQVDWQSGARALPPVHAWDPPLRGDMDLRVTRDGTWVHEGVAIGRPGLVRLFASILRREDDGHYYLVTPAEKWRFRVDDAPFVAVAMEAEGIGRGQSLTFRTSLGDTVTADATHPIRVVTDLRTGEPAPYVLVRDRLEALIGRAVFYDLVALAEDDGAGGWRVWSGGEAFPLGRVTEAELSEERA